MRKYLLPNSGKFYKANLHAHATGSDGEFTPEQMKQEYKKRGYSVLSITEHEILKDYTQYSDEDFIFINGYELSISENKTEDWTENKCAHLNLYQADKHNVKQVCYNPDAIWFAGDDVKNSVEYYGEIANREYSAEYINKVIQQANEKGFIVCLNHPYWSLQEPWELCEYKGLFALEIYNTDNCYWGWPEYDIYAYDIMSRHGIRIAPQMADDNHNHDSEEDKLYGSFGGFNMIKAEEFSYEAIFEALKEQNFYCSQGPQILDLYVEDGFVHIKTSPVKEIILVSGIRHTRRKFAKQGEFITEAKFPLKDNLKYVRFDVVDENQKHANTRAYFSDEWE